MRSLLAGLILAAAPAWACACFMESGGCRTPTGDAIFLGKVVSIERVQTGSAMGGRLLLYTANVRFAVTEHFRGPSTDSIVVANEQTDCAYPFEADHEYLIFAHEYQGRLMVDKCTGTRPAKMSASILAELRAARDGTALPDLFGFVGTQPPAMNQEGWEQIQPVPGLTVTARSEQKSFETHTGDDGLYAFRDLPKGRYRVSVQPPEKRLALWGGSEKEVGANAGLGPSCPLDFEIFYDGSISGTVTSGEQPASGTVMTQYVGPGKQTSSLVGVEVKDGRFEIGKLAPGQYRLIFQSSAPPRRFIYYPGKQFIKEATFIELGDGEHLTGVQFTVN